MILEALPYQKRNNEEQTRNQISNTIFATIFAASVNNLIVPKNLCSANLTGLFFAAANMVLHVLIFCIIYVFSYMAYNWTYKTLVKHISDRKVNAIDGDIEAIRKRQKDFDNIACDSILAAQSYQESFEYLMSDTNSENKMAEFYYFEVLHCLDVASQKTVMLLFDWKNCIRTNNKADGVDVFRVENVLELMKNLMKFLDDNITTVCRNVIRNDEIIAQVNKVKARIKEIENSLSQIPM